MLATPLQALCDFVFLMRRQGVAPEQVATFRHLPERESPEAAEILRRYPATVQRHVRRLVDDPEGTVRTRVAGPNGSCYDRRPLTVR